MVILIGWRQSLSEIETSPDTHFANESFPISQLFTSFVNPATLPQLLQGTPLQNNSALVAQILGGNTPATSLIPLLSQGIPAGGVAIPNSNSTGGAIDLNALAAAFGVNSTTDLNNALLSSLLTPAAVAALMQAGINPGLINISALNNVAVVNQIVNNLNAAIYNNSNSSLTNVTSGNGTAASASAGSQVNFAKALLNYTGPIPTITFDEFVALHKGLSSALASLGSDVGASIQRLSLADNRLMNLLYLGRVHFAPSTPSITPQLEALVQQLNRTSVYFNEVFDRIFPDEQSAVDYSLRDWTKDFTGDVNSPNSSQYRTWAVVVFSDLDFDLGVVDYTIRMNYSTLPSTKNVYSRFSRTFDTAFQKYYLSGFLSIQNMIEDYVLEMSQSNVSTANRPPLLRSSAFTGVPFPLPAYSVNNFYTFSSMLGLVMCMSLLYPVSRLMKAIVEEKETRTKETMFMMGLTEFSFFASWFITYFVIFFFISVVVSLMLSSSVLHNSSRILVFFLIFFFCVSMLCFSFLASAFFSKAKLAGIIGPLVTFALALPRFTFVTYDDTDLIGAKVFTCLLSPSAFVFGSELMMTYEGAGIGINRSNASSDPLSFNAILTMLVFDCFLYLFLAYYLDKTLPNEYGANLRPWFFCTKRYWFSDRTVHTPQPGDDAAVNGPSIEPVSGNMKDLLRVRIRHLRKVWQQGFGARKVSTVAVADLSLDMYEGQILALLGHNGAGKTTTISMLTGLIKPTSGHALVDGYDLSTQLREIRGSLGVCPQHNVLFPTLTVYEHLRHYATLKGVPSDRLESEVDMKIKEVGLADKRNVYSNALSGGMQRRLSVAIALIGDSKVVFLDEPTSGMDPYARRATWDLLRKSKKGRVIVLTTHFMDEADLLGDSIAIMAKGKLQTQGSSLFLKSRYGVGYNLTMVKEDERCVISKVTDMVTSYVKDAQLFNASAGEMAYRLPLGSVSGFPALFKYLEDHRDELSIGGYGISMTTLEEVFIRLSQINESQEAIDEVNLADNPRLSVTAPMTAAPPAASLHGPLSSPSNLASPISVKTSPEGVPEGIEMKPLEKLSPHGSSSGRNSVDGDDLGSAPSNNKNGGGNDNELNLNTTATDGNSNSVVGRDGTDSISDLHDSATNSRQKLQDGDRDRTRTADDGVPPPSTATDSGAGGGVGVGELRSPSEKKEDAGLIPPVVKGGFGDLDYERPTHPSSFCLQVKELLRKRYLTAKRDPKGRCFEVLLPVIVVILVLLILLINNNPAGPSIILSAELYQNAKYLNTLVTEVPYGEASPPRYALESHPEFISLLEGPVATLAVPNINSSMDMSFFLLDTRAEGMGRRFAALVSNDTLAQGTPLLPPITAQQLLVGVPVNQLLPNIVLPQNTAPVVISDARFLDALNASSSNNNNTANSSIVIPPIQVTLPQALQNLTISLGPTTTVVAVTGTNYSVNVPTAVLNPVVTFNGGTLPLQEFLKQLLALQANGTTNATNPIFFNNGTSILPADTSTITFGPNSTIVIGNQTFPVKIALQIPGSAVNTLLQPFNFTLPVSGVNTSTFNQTAANELLTSLLTSQLDTALAGLNNIKVGGTLLTLMHNSSAWHAVAAYAAEVMQVKMKMLFGRTNNDTRYTVRNHPLPLTAQGTLTRQATLSVISAIFVLVPFCYLPASFVIFLVRERNVKAKHLQLVSGVNQVAYWLSNYMWDMINYTFICVAVLIIFIIYNNEAFVGTSSATGATFLMFWLYGLAVIPMSYCFSFGFQNHISAQIGIAGIHFVLGFVLVIADNVMDGLPKTAPGNAKMKPYYRLFPSYTLGSSMIELSILRLSNLLTGNNISPFDYFQLGRNLLYLTIEGLVYFLIALVIEYRFIPDLWHRCTAFIWRHLNARYPNLFAGRSGRHQGGGRGGGGEDAEKEKPLLGEEDDDVINESSRVRNGKTEGDLVILNELELVYPARGGKGPMHAVNGLCLGIAPGTCFGFLGINGAGKTSTMKILTGEEEPTGGSALIKGLNVQTQLQEVRREVGYCPQFDPLLDLLTAREHLTLFARLRGIEEKKVKGIVDRLIEQVGLEQHADKVSKTYSGGNKRKLSLGLALVGGPSVVFLDEPSTGMDPVSRRFMWDVVARVKQSRSVILTTHSMEECEALCGKLCIMVAGRLQCLGSIQHLKNKYGSGYEMEINTTDAAVERVKSFVAGLFEDAKLQEEHGGRLKYRVPKQKLSLSSIFGAIEAEKQMLEIRDYSISQSTLEQIFVAIARAKDPSNPEPDAEPMP